MKPRTTNRNRSYYRNHRERAIKRKVHVFQNIWGIDLIKYENGIEIPFPVGRWSKGKVHCSCKMCKYEKYYNIEKTKYKEKKRLMEEEIEEFLYMMNRD